MYQEPSIALSLILRHSHYAGYIVLLLAMFLFGKISNKMATLKTKNPSNFLTLHLNICPSE
jgi:hypothetical protein